MSLSRARRFAGNDSAPFLLPILVCFASASCNGGSAPETSPADAPGGPGAGAEDDREVVFGQDAGAGAGSELDASDADSSPFDEFSPGQNAAAGGSEWLASLEVELPTGDSFLLRGTVPLPPGAWDGSSDVVPFAIEDADGEVVPSQVEVTSRYPRPSDGIDVVEVLARVQRPQDSAPGTRHAYRVIDAPHEAPPAPAHLDVRALTGPEDLDHDLLELLADPEAIELRAFDPFGNVYVHWPLAAEHQQVRKYGSALAEVMTYGVMMPESPQGGSRGTLPHFFGVHAYLRTFAGEPTLGLDLRFHNGFDGHDESTAKDDALDKLYFERIELVLPASWVLEASFEDPFLGNPTYGGSRLVVPLVKPMKHGRMHVMPVQGQFHRRLAAAPADQRERARAAITLTGLGFARRGFNELDQPLWSWWNPETARYLPQSFPVPNLSHLNLSSLRDKQQKEMSELAQIVLKGKSLGDYPIPDKNLGWAHPWGVAYGGMTGGLEIHFADGHDILATGSRAAIRHAQLVHRMHTSRQPAVVYRVDGEPTSVETWLESGTQYGGYVPFDYFLLPKKDPFGVSDAPKHQINYVEQAGLTPAYEDRLLDYQPHDFQHFVRYTRSPKILAWLTGDKLAMDDLRMMAETFHLSFHPYANNQWGGIQGSGLRALMNHVAGNPGVGLPFGRGEGWGVDCALAAYRTASPVWRGTKKPWLETIAETIADGQSSCTGFFQSVLNNKGLDGKYRVRQHIEHCIAENALRGLVESVFLRADPALENLTLDVLEKSNYGGIGPMAWDPNVDAPWRWTAVAPPSSPIQPWCSPSQLPADWFEPDKEKYLLFQSLANGYEQTGDTVFFDRALKVLGGSDLLQKLEKDGLNNVANRGALLAIVQMAHGQL